jgi:hypothetical protein
MRRGCTLIQRGERNGGGGGVAPYSQSERNARGVAPYSQSERNAGGVAPYSQR